MHGFSRIAFVLSALSFASCNCGHNGIPLQGTDPLPYASPDPLDFGPVPVNVLKALPLTVGNKGNVPLVPGKLSISGPNAGDFAIAGSLPAAIPIANSAPLSIRFQPSAAGVRNAVLLIPSNSSAIPMLQVPLTGLGGDVAIVASPQPLNFGDVLVNTSVSLRLMLTNQGKTGSDPIQIGAFTGPQASDFTQTSTPAAIPSMGSLPIQVSFTPTAVGPASASLAVTLCNMCQPTNLNIIGEGVAGALTFVPSPVSFQLIPTGTTAHASVTATNSGTAQIVVATLDLQSQQSAPFALGSVSTTLPVTLDAGANFTFDVSYTPTAATGDHDTIEATWAASGGAPATALDDVYGNETLNPCRLTISPPSVNFGNVQVGQLVKKQLTFGNTGQETCNLTNLKLDPSSDPAFTLPAGPQASLTVPAAGTAQIEVDCNVPAAGTPTLRRGSLSFQSNDVNRASATVTLSAYLGNKSPYSAGWPKWHNDNTDRGQSESDTANLRGIPVWTYPVAPASSVSTITGNVATYMNSPVVGADGTVYQTTLDGKLIAVDPAGSLVWSAPISSPATDPHPATPIIAADGTLFLESGTDGNGNAYLYHFGADGGLLAAVNPPTDLCNPNTASSGAGCPDGFDVCPSIANSGLLFDGDDFGATVTYTRNADGTLTEGKGTVLNWQGERVAVAIDDADNSYWCSANLCFGVTAPAAGFQPIPAWPSSGVTIPTSGGSAGGFINSDLAYDRDHTGWLIVEAAGASLFGNNAQTTVVALDPTNGAIQWTQNLPAFTTPTNPGLAGVIFSADFGNSAPAIADDGTIYVGNGDGLYALDGATGAIKPGFPFLSADVDTAPAIGGDGTIFFGCSDGSFYAIHPDGTQRFKVVTGGRISASPAIGPDGTVFFVSDEGKLYAIQ